MCFDRFIVLFAVFFLLEIINVMFCFNVYKLWNGLFCGIWTIESIWHVRSDIEWAHRLIYEWTDCKRRHEDIKQRNKCNIVNSSHLFETNARRTFKGHSMELTGTQPVLNRFDRLEIKTTPVTVCVVTSKRFLHFLKCRTKTIG